MIVVHDPSGSVTQTIDEPASPGWDKVLADHGLTFVRTTEDFSEAGILGIHVEGGEVKRREPLPAEIDKVEILADGDDKAIISGLPRPCTVLIDGEPVERKGGTLTLTSDMPGDYLIEVRHWPFLDWTATVRAR